MSKIRDYTGMKFGYLTAIEFVRSERGRDGRQRRVWSFYCEACNSYTEKIINNIAYRGHNFTCGCIREKLHKGLRSLQNNVYNSYRDGDITLDKFIELSQQKCYYCNKWRPNLAKHRYQNITWEYHGLDRVNNDLPHLLSNCVSCCWLCNDRKSDETFPEFMEWISDVYHNRVIKWKEKESDRITTCNSSMK